MPLFTSGIYVFCAAAMRVNLKAWEGSKHLWTIQTMGGWHPSTSLSPEYSAGVKCRARGIANNEAGLISQVCVISCRKFHPWVREPAAGTHTEQQHRRILDYTSLVCVLRSLLPLRWLTSSGAELSVVIVLLRPCGPSTFWSSNSSISFISFDSIFSQIYTRWHFTQKITEPLSINLIVDVLEDLEWSLARRKIELPWSSRVKNKQITFVE